MLSLHDSTWLAFWMAEEAAKTIWPEAAFHDRRFGKEEEMDSDFIPKIWDSLPDDVQTFLHGAQWKKKTVRIKAGIGKGVGDVDFICTMARVGLMNWQPLHIKISLDGRKDGTEGVFNLEVVRYHRLQLVQAG